MLPVFVMDDKFEDVEIDSSSHEVQAGTAKRKGEDITRHYLSRCYICYICKASFKKQPGLKMHMLNHNGKQRVDHRSFASLARIPKEVAYQNVECDFSCKICDKKFIDYQTLKFHEATNHTLFPYKCYICCKEYTVKTSLKHHLQSHQKKPKPRFPCSKCNKTFPQQRLLDSHLRFHNKRPVCTCEICSKTFLRKVSLQRHMTVHTNNRHTFACEICSKTYLRKKDLRIHMSDHTGEGKNIHNVSQICHKTFSRKGNLQNHILNHRAGSEKKMYQCKICEKVLAGKRYFDTHVERHKNTCKHCNKAFLTPDRLNKHLALHTCQYCGRFFKLVHFSNIKWHMDMHTRKGHAISKGNTDANCKDNANVNCKENTDICNKKDVDINCKGVPDAKNKQNTKANCKEDSYTKFKEDAYANCIEEGIDTQNVGEISH